MQTIKLIDVCEFVRNGANIKQLSNETRGIPITRIETLANDRFNRDRLGYANITDDSFSDYYLKKGDVLLSHINGAKFIGRSVMYEPEEGETIIHGMNLLCLRFKSNYNPKFFCYYAKSKAAKNYFDKHTKKAVNQASITSTDIKNMPIPDISIDEQNRIVEVLDLLASRQNDLNTQRQLFAELVRARFNELFSDCEKTELHTIANIVMGQSPKSSSYNNEGNGIPFFQGKADYGEKYTVIKHWTNAPKKIVDEGAVLMSVRAPVGPVNIANARCCIGRGLCGINAIKSKTNNEFLYNALKVMEDDISELGKGSTFNAINKDDVYGLLIPNASIPKQNEFSSFSQTIDISISSINKELEMCSELINKKMSDYFFEYEED